MLSPPITEALKMNDSTKFKNGNKGTEGTIQKAPLAATNCLSWPIPVVNVP